MEFDEELSVKPRQEEKLRATLNDLLRFMKTESCDATGSNNSSNLITKVAELTMQHKNVLIPSTANDSVTRDTLTLIELALKTAQVQLCESFTGTEAE